jgi:hypothetical protein
MSGELIGESRGKIIGTRVVELLETSPKIETTDLSTGRLLGIESQDLSTAWSVWRSPDTFHAEGSGVVTSKDGEMAMYTGMGMGKGSASDPETLFHGLLFFRSSTPQVEPPQRDRRHNRVHRRRRGQQPIKALGVEGKAGAHLNPSKERRPPLSSGCP